MSVDLSQFENLSEEKKAAALKRYTDPSSPTYDHDFDKAVREAHPEWFWKNKLFFGDNIDILRHPAYIPNESVDLVYLDPPFNSNADYNVLFSDHSGRSTAQITAFTDTWHWSAEAEDSFQTLTGQDGKVGNLLRGYRNLLGENDMLAYMVMITLRLIHLHRVLRKTGSLYLHCDPNVSHYVKLMLDAIFGPRTFRTEISWRRSNPKSHGSTNIPNCRDVILRYSKSPISWTFNKVFGEHDQKYVSKAYRYTDSDGRRFRLLPLLNPNDNRPNLTYEFLGIRRVWRWTKDRMEQAYRDGLVVQLAPGAVPQYKLYLDESKGRTITNDWHDVKPVGGKEALGYPTQKPEAILERIILISSNEGDVVLDPFCGCGTTIAVAEKFNRKWIGIDVTHLAIGVMRDRLLERFGEHLSPCEIIGEPSDCAGARVLADQSRHQYESWALSLFDDVLPVAKNRDKPFRVIEFEDDGSGVKRKVLVQAQSGMLSNKIIQELQALMRKEGAEIGAIISLEPPSDAVKRTAISAGFYRHDVFKSEYPKVQIITVEEALGGKRVAYPKVAMLTVLKDGQRVNISRRQLPETEGEPA
jgi:site-specific DNA-methyltransferase (adenine-specific)